MIDERQRHELYRGVEELLGTERADTLMSLLPPVGWADVATKDDIRLIQADLRNLEERMDARFSKVDARFEQLVGRFDSRFEQVDSRFEQLEYKLDAKLERALREQTRTLMLGLLGALFTMTSLCLGAIAFTG